MERSLLYHCRALLMDEALRQPNVVVASERQPWTGTSAKETET